MRHLVVRSKVLEEEAFLNLMVTHERLMNETAYLFKSYGLSSPAQYNVLRILRGAGDDGLPCCLIGERLISRVPDVTRLIDRMEKQNWVSRERSDADRRIVRTRLTDKGKALLATLDEPIIALHKKSFAPLAPTEIAELNRLLLKLRPPAATENSL